MIARDQRLDSFTRSYIETALWSSMDNANDQGGEPLDANYGPDDIDPHTMAQMIADCTAFQERNAELLSASGLSDKRAGFYFWLSRNGHGSGFFDENLDALQDAAKAYGEFDLYVGDDGVIYAMGYEPPMSGRADVNEARRPGRGADPTRPYPRPVDRSTFLNTPEDMQWLRDVHLKDLDLKKYHSAILYGNEDSPHEIKVFLSDNPTVHDHFVTYWLEDGFYKKERLTREASPAGARAGEARPRPSPARFERTHRREPTGPHAGPVRRPPHGIRPAPAPAPTRSAHHVPPKKRSR
jgi:hypothetical protein